MGFRWHVKGIADTFPTVPTKPPTWKFPRSPEISQIAIPIGSLTIPTDHLTLIGIAIPAVQTRPPGRHTTPVGAFERYLKCAHAYPTGLPSLRPSLPYSPTETRRVCAASSGAALCLESRADLHLSAIFLASADTSRWRGIVDSFQELFFFFRSEVGKVGN